MQLGSRALTLRGETGWRGLTTTTNSDIGDRRFRMWEGFYPSGDGVEMRLFPGWKCVYDFEGVGNKPYNADGAGFYAWHVDGYRPVWEDVTDYKELKPTLDGTQFIWCEPTHLHFFKRVRGKLMIGGEGSFRKEPIRLSDNSLNGYVTAYEEDGDGLLTMSGNIMHGGDAGSATVAGTVITDGTKNWTVNQFATGYTVYFVDPATGVYGSAVITANTATTITVSSWGSVTPLTGWTYSIGRTDAAFNCLRPGMIVWLDGFTGTGAATLNQKFHVVKTVADGSAGSGPNKFRIETPLTAGMTATGQTARAYIVGKGQGSYPVSYPDLQGGCDDPESLMTWSTLLQPDVDTLRTICYPAHVFNRQRDFGDQSFPGFTQLEGHHIAGNSALNSDAPEATISRRRKRSLPYRMCPDVANSRLLMGAPGYGCVFQAPVAMALDLAGEGSSAGFPNFKPNQFHDKPRAVGIPKAMMVVDKVLESGGNSLHFPLQTDIEYVWGGFETFKRGDLFNESGTITALVSGGGTRGFQDSSKTWSTSPGQWDRNTNSRIESRWFISLSTMTFAQVEGSDLSQLSYSTGSPTPPTPSNASIGVFITGTPGSTEVRTNAASTLTDTENGRPYRIQKFQWERKAGTNYIQLDFTANGTIPTPFNWTRNEFAGRYLRYIIRTGGPAATGSFQWAYSRIVENGVSDLIVTPELNPSGDPINGIARTTSDRDGVDFTFGTGTGTNHFIPLWFDLGDPDERFGTYKFAVAYRDTATGEIGPLSESVELTIKQGELVNQGYGVRLFVMHPGYLLAESGALQVELYRTKRNGDTFYFDSVLDPVATNTVNTNYAPGDEDADHSIVFGVQPNRIAAGDIYRYTFTVDVKWKSDDDLEKYGSRYVPSDFETMPAGAVSVKTIRGVTFYGGRIGNSGKRLEGVYSNVTTKFDGPGTAYPDPSQVTLRNGVNPFSSSALYDGPWLAASATVPPGYCGVGLKMFSIGGVPGGTQSLTLLRQVNNEIGSRSIPYTAWPLQRIQVENPPFITGKFGGTEGVAAFGELPVGRYQWSQNGAPGVTPATNIGFVDADGEEDIQAIGAFNGGVILCTRTNTYYMNWTDEPRSSPDLASNEFGCIAQNSMVEFDGGVAWLSERGPCAMTGNGVEWVGRSVEAWFTGNRARYKCDSQGLMRHAWACHDPERGLIYFGLFSDRRNGTANRVTVTYRGVNYNWDTASDEARSRFPCDEVLVWSYRNNALSLWVPPAGLEVLWMERDFDVDGRPRILFLARDKRIYALDDEFNDTNKDVIERVATNSGSSGAITFSTAVGTDQAALGAGENYVRVGMNALIVRGTEPIYQGEVTAVTTNSVTLSLPSGASWRVGDKVLIGVRYGSFETNWVTLTGIEKPRDLVGIQMRYNLTSLYTGDQTNFDPQIAAAKFTFSASKPVNAVDSQIRTSSVATRDINELGTLRGLGYSRAEAEDTSQFQRFEGAREGGQSVKVKAEFWSGAQVRITDLVLEG